jgi:hypothetical protein
MRYSPSDVRRGIELSRKMAGTSIQERLRAAFTELSRIPVKRAANE